MNTVTGRRARGQVNNERKRLHRGGSGTLVYYAIPQDPHFKNSVFEIGTFPEECC